MKKMALVLICLGATSAWAEDEDVSAAIAVDELNERLSVIEVIDVTAEKPPASTEDEPDEDIDAILDAADALDNEDPE